MPCPALPCLAVSQLHRACLPPPPQLDVAFRQRDSAGEPLRHGAPEVAAALGLPLLRAEKLLAVRAGVPACAARPMVQSRAWLRIASRLRVGLLAMDERAALPPSLPSQ